ncbi:ABC transporter permease [Tritonibacter sp. SIMBA_163]|uniref:ABC transporter permease n=1 Tax=Tritonibacter sp. SIMBA_163 TaxID=3080868 RepID=UPI0039812126
MTQLPALKPLRPAQRPQLRWRGARSVIALILREMSTSYGRSPGGYLWAVLQPLAMIAMLTLAFSVLLRSPSLGTSFLLFYATGFLVLRMFQEVHAAVSWAIGGNQSLLAYPGVTYVDALLARGILAILTQLMVSGIVFWIIFTIEDIRVIMDFVPILQAFGGVVLLSMGVGTFNAYMSFSFPVYKTVWSIATRPLMLVSGIFYIYEDLPLFAQNILWFNPLIHLGGVMRTGFYASYDPSYISMTYVCIVGAVPMFFGVLLLRRYAKDILYK